jgi:serine/threonine protein kinase
VAPEVADNGSIGLPADIWSLGCSVIELLTGEPPYSSLSNSQALCKIVDDDYPPLPSGLSPV